jgi:2-pyrone-4,6-dicarboxylate lactonase
MAFDKTPGWLDWYAGPSQPRFKLPPAVWTRTAMSSAPATSFPLRPNASTHPATRRKQQLFALRDHLGFARNVIVQATCHGADNRAMVDACIASGGKARGVATVRRSVTERTAGHARGRRARRALQLRQAPGGLHAQGRTAGDRPRIAPLGWHVVIYFEAVDLPELWDFFTALPTTVVVDHMGRPDVGLPVDGPQFALFEKFMREHGNVWSKVSCPERLSVTGPKA